VHCVLLSILSLFTSTAISASSATLYGISPAVEGDFLTRPFELTTVVAGTDGVITVIDTAATDELTAHGTYAVTLFESSNGLVYHASGSLYQESMSCALDTVHSEAACVASISLPNNTIVTSFTPTALPVVAVVPISSASSFPSTPSTGSSATPSQTHPADSSNSGSSGLSSGALAGIIVAIVVVVLIVIGLIFYLARLRKKRQAELQLAADVEKFELERPPAARLPDTRPDDADGFSTAMPSSSMPSSSQLFVQTPSSPISEKRRMALATSNPDQWSSIPTAEAMSTAPSSDAQSAIGTVVSSSDSLDARRIMEEMRRMREEVAQLRETSAVPPEYTE